MSFVDQLREGLSKTRKNFTERMEDLVGASVELDDDFMDELEMILVVGDVGIKTTEKIMAALRDAADRRIIKSPQEAIPFIKKYISDLLTRKGPLMHFTGHPSVVLVVGVNGVGKTTTIGKLSNYYRLMGYKVIMAAADTFRAGAVEQLKIWGQKAQVDVISHGEEGADPAAVVYDGVQAAIARNADVLFVDTAGRLHNKTNLMKELEKIYRVIRKEIPDGPHETLLVLDATTGQNAINQAKIFLDTAHVTGVVLTKLDGTAKGGVVVAIKEELGLDVKWIGIGEGMMDFRPFDPKAFVDALFDRADESKEDDVKKEE
jgi:fused signal recognition particle receptor